ncbi:MAG: response regulator [Thermodesulfobacteriota bacterium]
MRRSEIKVLVVDDDDLVRLVLTAFLEDEGYTPLEAATGEEGLGLAADPGVRVAVVDLGMPGMDGAAFILEAHRRNPDLRFVIHSGSGRYTLSQALREIGLTPEQVFPKPIQDLGAFSQTLRKLIEPEDV